MSLNYNQIIRQIEKECGFRRGDILDKPERKQDFTEDINLALDKALSIIIPASGGWQYDDWTHPDYSILTTDLIPGQQDYSFVEDETGNLILDIYKVMIKRDNGYEDIKLVDRNRPNHYTFDKDVSGSPMRYDLLGNGIFLDPKPDQFVEKGLKVFVNREAVYFSTEDDTKKPGIDGRFHEYLALVPSYKYARQKSLNNVDRLKRDIDEMERAMGETYQARARQEVNRFNPVKEDNR